MGYAQQVTKCCNCSGFIEVLDASNQVMYTIQGESQSLLTDFSVCLSLECAEKLTWGMCYLFVLLSASSAVQHLCWFISESSNKQACTLP